MVRRHTGMGLTLPGEELLQLGTGTPENIPWWCPVSDFLHAGADSCRIPTESDLRTDQAAAFGPAMTPDSQAAAIAAGDEAVAAYARLHPDEYANYLASVSYQSTPWLTYALLAGGAFLLAKAVN